MGRLFVYDENMTDERAKITVAKMAAVSDIVASEKAFIQYSAAGQLTVLAGAVIAVGDAIFQTEETTLSAANLDGASSFAHGKDYYIYLCNNGKDSSNEWHRFLRIYPLCRPQESKKIIYQKVKARCKGV